MFRNHKIMAMSQTATFLLIKCILRKINSVMFKYKIFNINLFWFSKQLNLCRPWPTRAENFHLANFERRSFLDLKSRETQMTTVLDRNLFNSVVRYTFGRVHFERVNEFLSSVTWPAETFFQF